MSKKIFLFWVTSLSIISIITLPLFFIFHAYPSLSEKLLNNHIEEAQNIASYISSTLDLKNDKISFTKKVKTKKFNNTIKQSQKNFGIIKIKVFSKEGIIIYSTDENEAGIKNEYEYFHNIVAKGNTYSKIVKKTQKSLENKIQKKDVVETYIPITNNKTFIGAFEIYYDITKTMSELKNNLIESLIVISAIMIILILIIIVTTSFAIKYHKTRIQAETKIKEINVELSMLFNISKVINKSINLDELLPEVLMKILEFDLFSLEKKGGIFLLDGQNMILTAQIGHDQNFIKDHDGMKIEDCLCGEAAKTGKIIISNDCHKYDFKKKSNKNKDKHCHVIVPLLNSKKVLGVLYLYLQKDKVISKRKKQLLKTIGNQLGIMIGNALLYKKTKELSLIDPLTGLSNRRDMNKNLDKQISHYNRYKINFSAIMLDIDFFKQYNDTYGHESGDNLLVQIAKIILLEIRANDLAARYGGEEFVIILPKSDKKTAYSLAKRIHYKIKNETQITVSMGISSSQNLDPKEVLPQADKALYEAKNKGRNRIIIAESSCVL